MAERFSFLYGSIAAGCSRAPASLVRRNKAFFPFGSTLGVLVRDCAISASEEVVFRSETLFILEIWLRWWLDNSLIPTLRRGTGFGISGGAGRPRGRFPN